MGGEIRRRDRLPPSDGGERDARGAHPHQRDEQADLGVGHPARVVDGVGDGPVAIQADDTQVENRRRGGQHVQGMPEIAPFLSVQPHLVRHLVRDGKRHDDTAHHDIGDGQRHDEVVGDGAEV